MNEFLKSGIGFGIVNDQMSVALEESKIIKEQSGDLLQRARSLRERMELTEEQILSGC
jgi:hypothetical protein